MNTPASLPNGDEFLLLPEIAPVLRCSVKTVRRLIQDGKLKSVKIRGRVFVLKSAFHDYFHRIKKTR
ncbi:helix-turn-helix domain-containing protein [Oleiharenicola lentus]|nr:helix-turn-helix domain-containing protein [Oleiharenicola lentus]